MTRRHVLPPTIAVAALLAAAGLAAAQTVPTGFVHELVIGGPWTGEPVALAFLPDGRPIVLERNGGGVRLAASGASSSSLILTIPNVSFELERGLLGVAVDPAWPSRPYVYFYHTRTDAKSVVVMYEASGALTDPNSTAVTLADPFTVLEIPDAQPLHNGGTLRFGPDGMLYVSIGEDLTPCNAQNLVDLRGKILRLDVSAMPGGGAGPPPKADITPADNPFAANPDEDAKLVYAWGLRNPFRFSVDPATGDLWIGDVGFISWEEVDRVPAGSGGGQNFGWPIREGPEPSGTGDTCGAGNAFTAPEYFYEHGAVIAASIGGPMYRAGFASPNALPASYDGSYFHMDWGGEWMRRLVEGPGGWAPAPPAPGQPDPVNWGTGLGQISDIEIGPDGALWLAQKGGAVRGIYRIRRTLPTEAPVAAAGGDALRVTVHPNPAFAARTVEFRWVARTAAPLSLRIVDAAGRLVREMHGDGGAGAFRWSSDGAGPAAGVYFYELDAAGATARGRLVRLR